MSDDNASSAPTRPLVPVIATQRLILRAWREEDADALFPALSDPELTTWWSRAPYTDVEELRRDVAARDRGNWRGWVITRIGDDRAIGQVAAGEKRQGGVTEIGYFLAREAHGKGIAREAASGLIGQLFAEGQRRVFADTDPDNLRSIALLERLGFRLEGRLRNEWHTHIGVRDSLIYGLLAEEWQASQRPPPTP